MLPGPLSQRGVAERELDLVERIKPENDSDEILIQALIHAWRGQH